MLVVDRRGNDHLYPAIQPSPIQVLATVFASTTLKHKLKVDWFWRNSVSLQLVPQTGLRYGTKTVVLWSGTFRIVTSQNQKRISRQEFFGL